MKISFRCTLSLSLTIWILSSNGFLNFQRFRFSLFVDRLDAELVLLLGRQAGERKGLLVGTDFSGWDPSASVQIHLFQYVARDFGAAVVFRLVPFNFDVVRAHLLHFERSLRYRWLICDKN